MLHYILTPIAKKCFEVGVKSILDQIMRVYYFFRGAVSIVIQYNDLTFKKACPYYLVNYYNQDYEVKVIDIECVLQEADEERRIELLWIPGKKRARVSRYSTDRFSRKVVFLCDVVSITSFVGFITLFFLHSPSKYVYYFLIVLIIISSIIRQKKKIKYANLEQAGIQ